MRPFFEAKFAEARQTNQFWCTLAMLAENPTWEAMDLLHNTLAEVALNSNERDEILEGLAANQHEASATIIQQWFGDRLHQPTHDFWTLLSRNPSEHAIRLLRENVNYIDWEELSANTSDEAITLLLEHPDQIDWTRLSGNSNPRAIDLLRSNPSKISLSGIVKNSSDFAAEYICQNYRNLTRNDWLCLTVHNEHPRVIQLLAEHPERIDLGHLCDNYSEAGCRLLLANVHQLNEFHRNSLSLNPCDLVVDYLLANPTIICAKYFASNSNSRVPDFMEANPDLYADCNNMYHDKLRVMGVWSNEAIFQTDFFCFK